MMKIAVKSEMKSKTFTTAKSFTVLREKENNLVDFKSGLRTVFTIN